MLLLALPALLGAPALPAARPLPFSFQASPAYGAPDRAEDRPFDAAEFKGRDGKPFKKEGRYFQRQWHYHKESGEEKPSSLWVTRNVENALTSAGAEVWTLNNTSVNAKAVINDRTLWIRVDCGADYFTMVVIQEEPMQQAFTAEFISQGLEKDGFVALDVHFRTDSAEILADSTGLLDRAADTLKAHPTWTISVEGHTDATGSADHNRSLSAQRAQSVLAALQQRGIPAASLKSAGFGSDQPVADNRTEEGRAKNRRVELVRVKH